MRATPSIAGQEHRGLGRIMIYAGEGYYRRLVAGSVAIYLFLAAGALGDVLVRRGILDLSAPAALWLNLAVGYWLVLSMVLACGGVGRAVFRLPYLRRCQGPPLLRAIFQIVAGAYVSYCLLMLLGAFNRLNAPGFALYLLTVLGIGIIELHRWRRRTRDGRVSGDPVLTASDVGNKWAYLILVGVVIWALPYLGQTLLPNTEWDSAAHHLPIAKTFLQHGIWQVDEAYAPYNFPGAVHLFYALFLFLGAESGIIPLSFVVSVGLIMAVYALTAHFWGGRAGFWAAAVCLGNNLLWEVGITARIDAFLALFCFLACGALLLWLSNREQTGWLMVCGMMLGLATGTKYTAIFFVAVLGVGGLLALLRGTRREIAARAAPAALGLCLVVFPSAAWYVRNAAQLGDPLYDYVQGPVYRDVSGELLSMAQPLNRATQEALALPEMREFMETLPSEGPGAEFPTTMLNPYSVLAHPERHARRPLHTVTPFIMLFFILPLAQRDRLSIWLYVLGWATLILIGSQSYLLRYALPVLPLLSVGAGLCLARARSRGMVVRIGVVMVALPLYYSGLEWRKVASKEPVAYWSGAADRIQWLSKAGYNDQRVTPRIIRSFNEKIDAGQIPRDATVFMVGEEKGNLLKCRFLPDGSRYAQRWMAEFLRAGGESERLMRNLEQQGIEYFFWNYEYLNWCLARQNMSHDQAAVSLYHFDQFRSQHIDIIYELGGVGYGRIKSR